MIDDAALFRPTVSRALTVRPHDTSGALPPFTPKRPRGGWTPASVFAASLDYGATDAADVDLGERRIVSVAQRALFAALPHEVKRAQIVERLHGIDPFSAHFAEPRRAPPTPSVHDPVEEDDTPF